METKHKAPSVTEIAETSIEELEPQDVKMDVRLAIDWDEDDQAAVDFISGKVDELISREFGEVRRLTKELMEKTCVESPYGSGWALGPDGHILQDWGRLTYSDLEQFVMAGSVAVYTSQAKLEESYQQAVFAKFTYDDAYDKAYTSQLSGTIGDKTARAKRRTMDERWCALFKTLYQKRARSEIEKFETLVRRMDRIRQDRVKVAEQEFRASRA